MLHAILFTAALSSIGGRSLTQRASQVACPTFPSCPVDNGCKWQDPSNGAKFIVSCSVDLVGGDMQTAQTSSYGDCLNACAVTNKCVAVSYTGGSKPEGGFCYLKDTIQPAASAAVVAAAQLTGKPRAKTPGAPKTSCNGAISCPLYDNCRYTSGTSGMRQKSFAITCGHDLYGGDLMEISAETMEACVNACASMGGCVAVSYKESIKMCYMKSSIRPAIYAPTIAAAYLYR